VHKYKELRVNDKIRIIRSSDPFTRKITVELFGKFGVITNVERNPGGTQSFFVYTDALKTDLYLQRDALEYYGSAVPFTPLHRVLSNGEVINAGISGKATEDNKSVVHVFGGISLYPICGSRSTLDYHDINLELGPIITCQKCLSIMYHRRRKLLESLK